SGAHRRDQEIISYAKRRALATNRYPLRIPSLVAWRLESACNATCYFSSQRQLVQMTTIKTQGPKVLVLSVVAACMLLACHSRALALNPALKITQYAHTSWTAREG